MSKKKKKKKKSADRFPKNYKEKEKRILFVILLIYFAFYFAYFKLSEIIALRVYSPYYFVSSKFGIVQILLLILLLIVALLAGTYLIEGTKTPKKKYIFRSSAIIIISLISIIIFNCNVWSFNKDTFSYNTIIRKDKIVYSYDDIDSAELYVHSASGKGIHDYIDYTFYMNDGKEIKFNAQEAFYTDNNKIIEFDKAIANKRTVKEGDYSHFLYWNDNLNDYFDSVYNNN